MLLRIQAQLQARRTKILFTHSQIIASIRICSDSLDFVMKMSADMRMDLHTLLNVETTVTHSNYRETS